MELLDLKAETPGDRLPRYHALQDGYLPSANEAVIVPLARLKADAQALAQSGAALAVRLESDELADQVAPYLAGLRMVEVSLPQFKDGRAFSTARRLREEFGFDGEIRASGHIVPDQAAFLRRCGVDTIVLDKPERRTAFEANLRHFDAHIYQPAADERPWAMRQRREQT